MERFDRCGLVLYEISAGNPQENPPWDLEWTLCDSSFWARAPIGKLCHATTGKMSAQIASGKAPCTKLVLIAATPHRSVIWLDGMKYLFRCLCKLPEHSRLPANQLTREYPWMKQSYHFVPFHGTYGAEYLRPWDFYKYSPYTQKQFVSYSTLNITP